MNEIFSSPLPLIAVLIPVGAAILIALTTSRHPNLRDSWSTAAAILLVAVVLLMLNETRQGRLAQMTIVELSPDINIALRADPAGMIFGGLASGLWILAGVYAVGYMRGGNEHKQTRFFSAFALSISAAIGVALAENLLTFVLFYELLTLLSLIHI